MWNIPKLFTMLSHYRSFPNLLWETNSGKKKKKKVWEGTWRNSLKTYLKSLHTWEDLKILGFSIGQCSCLINRKKHVDIPNGWKLSLRNTREHAVHGRTVFDVRSTVYCTDFQEVSINLPPRICHYLNINKYCHKRNLIFQFYPNGGRAEQSHFSVPDFCEAFFLWSKPLVLSHFIFFN